MSAKFKIGDRVVIARNTATVNRLERDSRVGSVLTVRRVLSGRICNFSENNNWHHDFEDLEHEYVYNSPLYTELK